MTTLMRVPLGLAVMAIGFLFVQKTDKFQAWFGQVDWAEQKFGNGGTRTFYKLVGALISIIGVCIVTNIISDFLAGLASFFVRRPNP